MSSLSDIPFVSIIVACRNEGTYIHSCIHSLLHNGYPPDKLELIIVDGVSSDDTWGTCEYYRETNPNVKLLSNPKRITPISWNIGVRESRGEYILIAGAHASYPRGYISDLVKASMETGAANVGGVVVPVPRDSGFLSKLFCIIKSDKFGVGKSEFRTNCLRGLIPEYVDTVFGGCYKAWVFDEVGYFNENLVHSQDLVFNLRLKRAGYKTLLVPWVKVEYFVKSGLRTFYKAAYIDGEWIVIPMLHTSIPIAGHRIMPLVLLLTLPLSIWPYLLLAFFRSYHLARREKDRRLLFALPWAFLAYHCIYGAGSFVGLIKVLWRKWK